MPLYEYKNTSIEGEPLEEHMVKMADAEQFLLDNPHLKRMISAPRICDPILIGRQRPSDGFNSILKEAAKVHPHGHINAR